MADLGRCCGTAGQGGDRPAVAVLLGLLTWVRYAVVTAYAVVGPVADLVRVRADRAELLADAAQLAATERTAVWLDQLTASAALTGEQRFRIAAEDGAATLTRVLRRAELAGHDPCQTLADAIGGDPADHRSGQV